VYCPVLAINYVLNVSYGVFNSIVNFCRINNVETVGLIGGEPFLHKNFFQFLKILDAEKYIKTIIIYTNGLFNTSYIKEMLSDKIIVSVNCNPQEMLQDKYPVLLKNLSALNDNNIYLGISVNLPNITFDYSYIFEILSMLDKNTLRFSYATPTAEKDLIKNPIDYFRKIHDYIMSFYRTCYEKDVIPITSCNEMPLCLLNPEDKRLLLKLHKKGEQISNINVLSCFRRCVAPVTILPDLTAIRCFSFSSSPRPSILKNSSLKKIENVFLKKIDHSSKCFINSNVVCKKCAFKETGMCRVCYRYKNK